MVNLIEIAKPLARLKGICQTQRRARLQTYYFKNIGLSIELQRRRSENELNALKEAFDHNVLTSGRYLSNPSAARYEFRGHGQAI